MNAKLVMAVAGCVCALAAGAEDRWLTAGDASPYSSFNSTGRWNVVEAPCAGNDYFTRGKDMRSPDAGSVTDEHVFQGDSLTVDGGSLAWKSLGTVTVTNLILKSGNLSHWQGNLAQDARLFGNIEILSGYYGKFACAASVNETDRRIFRVYASITGSGLMEIEMGHPTQPATYVKGVELLGDNSGFTGRMLLRGLGKLMIPSEEALGAVPAAFAGNHMEFQGITLSVTNSVTLDDPTRGILFNNISDAGAQRYPWGALEVNGTNTLTVACVISGGGALIKRGPGTLLLATNNTYTGATVVEAGTLRFDPAFDAVSDTVTVTGATSVVAGTGTLVNVTLAAGGTLRAEGGGWDVANLNAGDGRVGIDLSSADPDVTMIRVSGALTKPAFGAVVLSVVTNGALADTAYRVLTVPNLAAFSDADFCVDPPWLGTLSRSGDGTTLLFTPTLPENIVFKGPGNDPMGETAFTNTNWTTGERPAPGKTYVCQLSDMRLPASGNNTFEGDRLIFDYRTLGLKNPSGTATIRDVTVMNDAVFSMMEDGNSRLAGRVMLHPVLASGKSHALKINGWSNLRTLHLYAELAGHGRMEMVGTGNPAAGNLVYNLLGDNTNYYGSILLNGNSNFWMRVSRASSVGGALAEFRADAVSFNGGGIGATNDVELAAGSNRGITLLAYGGTAGTTGDTGSFPDGTPAEDRRYPGGATFRAENAGVTLIVNLPVTGAGSLSTAGSGTVVLGGDNSYTGLTSVAAGTLRAASPNAFGTSPVVVRAGAALQVPYPALPAMPNGVELSAAPVFEDGARVEVALAAEYAVKGSLTVPLFLLPAGAVVDVAAVPVVSTVESYSATVLTETVGSGAAERVRVSAKFWFNGGTMLLLQ